ncbi:MAG: hypothetical protein Q4G46_00240 [Propionibacteriaceae bacterium]|nr:hypothetical protein [Propionibacteriaceae bacterium]
MVWILAIAVSPARTWAARLPAPPSKGEPELIRLAPGSPRDTDTPPDTVTPATDTVTNNAVADTSATGTATIDGPKKPPSNAAATPDGPSAHTTDASTRTPNTTNTTDAPASDLIRTEGMPSAVWTDGQQTLVGVAALERAGVKPAGLILDPYALISTYASPDAAEATPAPSEASGGPEAVADPVDVVAALLGEVYRLAVDRIGSAPEQTLVTHPDGWSLEQIALLRRAANRAGLSIDPVPEPIAVAAAYRAHGGQGTRFLMLDADRNTASAIARMGTTFVVLGTASADDHLNAIDVLPRLADEALAQSGTRREVLDDVVVTGEALDPGLGAIGTTFLQRPATELPSEFLATGALFYDRSLHEVPPPPAPERPPPPPPPPPPVRINHAAPPTKKRLPIVPLLILILVVLVLAELLFVYWPF